MSTAGRISDLQRAILGAEPAPDADPLFAKRLDLRGELLMHGIDYRACQRLEALGIEGKFVAKLGAACAIGVGRVQLLRGDWWEPHGPDARLLLAVTESGVLADIIAVSTAHPDQIARRTGFGWCLGFDVYEAAVGAAVMAERRVTLRIYADPIAWLRARGEGLCVLDWALALPFVRGLGERVTLECDAGAGARIRAMLEIGGLPKVKERAPVARIEMGEAA